MAKTNTQQKARRTTAAAPARATGTRSAGHKAPRQAMAKAAPIPGDVAVPEVAGSEKEFLHFLPLAQAIAPRDIIPFRADAVLAYHNIAYGWESLAPLIGRIQAELPTVPIAALEELPRLALATVFAAQEVAVPDPSSGQTAALLAEARSLREAMLPAADAAAKAKLVPQAKVDQIKAGRGPRDTAQDCVDLATLFRKYAGPLQNKTPITAVQVERAAEVGSLLVTILKPKGARRSRKSAERVAKTETRDRMWTLVLQRVDVLRRVGMWLWGEAVDEHVPAVQSRFRPRPRKKAATTTATQSTTTATEVQGEEPVDTESPAPPPAKSAPAKAAPAKSPRAATPPAKAAPVKPSGPKAAKAIAATSPDDDMATSEEAPGDPPPADEPSSAQASPAKKPSRPPRARAAQSRPKLRSTRR